jgi:hypothetical protein
MAVAISAALGGACGDETIIYPGGPAGPAAGIAASRGLVVLHAGEAATIGLRAVDDSGNTVPGTAPSITSCDASIANVNAGGAADPWTSTAEVVGVALGQTCLVASAGSVPPETVRVNVGPRLMTLVGPDTVLSGATASFTLAFTDATGATVPAPATGFPGARVTSGNLLRMVIVPPGDPVSFSTAGQQPGTVTLTANLGADHGGTTARKTVTVAPGVFAGSFSATSAAPGSVITVTRAAGGPAFDADSKAALGAFAAYVDGFTADQLMFALPATGSTTAGTLLLSDMGPVQVAQTASITATKATEDVYAPGNTNATVSPPAGAPDASTVMTANNNIYLVHGGFGTGAASRGAWNGGTQVDHYVAVTTGAEDAVVTITLSWTNGSDVDLFILDDTGTEVANSFSGSTTQEVMTFTFPAGTTHFIGISMWSAGTDITNLRLRLAGL